MATPSKQAPRLLLLRMIVAALLCGVGASLLWALLEGARLFRFEVRPVQIFDPSLFFAAVFVMYALPSLVLGLAAGLLGWALRRRLERLGKGDPVGAATAILLPGMVLGWGALFTLAYANIYRLPTTALEPLSLGVDAGILAVAGALFAFSTAWLLRRGTFARPGVRVWGGRLGWAAAGLLLASFLVVRTTDLPVKPTEATRSAPKPERVHGPNILLISIDTLRSDHLSPYDYPRKTSPFIDKLAGEGALFRNSRSQASWTRPSAASLITSLYPSTHAILSVSDAIPEQVTTLFEYLKQSGYRTAVFSANGNVSRSLGFGQGVDDFYESTVLRQPRSTLLYQGAKRVHLPTSQALLRAISHPTTPDSVDDRTILDLWVIRRFQEWLGGLEAQPFSAYIHLLGVHLPYLPPPPYDRAFGSPYRSPDSKGPPGKGGSMMMHGERLPEAIRGEMIDRYDGLALFCDAQVRVAVEAVRRRGMLDDTLVIVTADHGQAFWDHWSWGHGNTLYEEMVRVPLILWAGQGLRKRNGRIPLGVEDVPVSTVDVMPTVLSLAGVRCPTCEGESLIDLAARGGQARETFMETQWRGTVGSSVKRSMVLDMYAIADGRQKLIYAKVLGADWEKWELYDLVADPTEERSLLDGPPNETMPLFLKMQARRKAALAKRSAAARVDLKKHPDLYEQLKALGYVQ